MRKIHIGTLSMLLPGILLLGIGIGIRRWIGGPQPLLVLLFSKFYVPWQGIAGVLLGIGLGSSIFKAYPLICDNPGPFATAIPLGINFLGIFVIALNLLFYWSNTSKIAENMIAMGMVIFIFGVCFFVATVVGEIALRLGYYEYH